MSIRIEVLGSLEVNVSGVDMIPTTPKPRQLFALLALNHRKVVPTTTILEELWGDYPPKSALTTLQTYVLQLRRKLAAVAGVSSRKMIATRNNGYMLALPESRDFDLEKYGRLESRALEEFRNGRAATAIRTAQEALELWRGDALADVPRGRYLEGTAVDLDQSRLALIECRLEAALSLGRHRESLTEFPKLITEHSYNENLHASYMIALHRCGIRDKALNVYHQLRSSMRNELGVEPSRKMQELHRALLSADLELDEPSVLSWSRACHRPWLRRSERHG
ncbi:AfsR/SARP family transcriptional regulator [Saccharopolyspora phatthalungensis]|uniref:DNA-binding SARP family transcriptional activator n=1 Tax=Saccharopolyspora phatthalungensis TaxID=664693 RepID=A0A840QE50_9PSEU|nr:AfsR/SARP family transcriptional regulator [Saccharopolyspora phatthalungensis]MBB5156849.1 DNA-binding SARP family transcriptional activator [Saccharopolyspora phatthalungensis]